MKYKIIIVLITLFTLLIHPMDSSESTNMELTTQELDIIVNNMKIKSLQEEINKEYNKFYLTLDSIQTNNNHVSKRTANFIKKLTCDAVNNNALPSIVIAQAAIETGYGRSNKLGNNIFGIKGRGIKTKTKEFSRGKFITLYSEFQYFNTLDDAIARHFEIISRYDFKTRDYVEWAFKIKRGGYATDPNYPIKLIYIIKKFELDRLDRIQEMNNRLCELENFNVLS